MPVKINFDSSGMPETPTFILSRRNGQHFGALNNVTKIRLVDNLNSPFEFSFYIYKILNGERCHFWNEINDFRIIYVPEWSKWFEIYVEIEESDNCVRKVSGTSLCEAELSQILLHNIEINTEDDIAKEDYSPTVLYEQNNAKASLLHRLLKDKAGHYKILHVDPSIRKIQRSFSFDNKSIYDAFQEISEEMHCLFVFGESDDDTIIPRTISVYDLESSCKDCGYRDEFMDDTCFKCGNHNIQDGYGEDTTIFVSNENLAEEINYSTDTSSVKNCFRLESGDDAMTAAIINANPSGTQYLWNIPSYMKKDMSNELVEKLESYDKLYLYYQKEHEENLDENIVNNYNKLVEKYHVYNEDLESIIIQVKGYQNLMKIYYDVIDFKGYLQNSLMPDVKISETNIQQQISLLNVDNLSPVSVENTSYVSLATANSVILAYAKVYIDTSKYRIKVKESSLSGTTWTGSFTLTNYSDEKDTADSKTITIQINDDYENFIKQKIDKILTKENEDISIIGLFKRTGENFKNELKKYSLSYLQIIYEACQSCLDILIAQGVSEKQSDLYNSIYKPYYDKSNFISQELKLREEEINIVDAIYDSDGDIIKDGMKSIIKKKTDYISDILDFKKYIGDYWSEFCAYRREDLWKNTNYISEGLNNKQLFERAEEFLDAARKDLIKSSTQQHRITTTLKNLLVIKSFEPLVRYFSVGNWLRLSVDEKIYKLRLISYEINYDSLNTISVEFSDVIEANGILSDIQSILNQSKSMGNSYDSVKNQASAGDKADKLVNGWVNKGLSATLTKIMNNADNQEVVFDKHGLLFREWEPETETYSPIQSKQINSTLAYTTDNWETTKAAIGKYIYLDPRDWKYKTGYGVIADTLIGNLILGEEVGIYNSSGSLTFDDNGLSIGNDVNSFKVNPNSKVLLSLSHNDKRLIYVDENGGLHIDASGNAIDFSSNDTINGMKSQIKQNAEAIVLKVTKDEVNSIIEQKADSIRLKADKISWQSTYSSMSESGILKCSSAELEGSLFCGSKTGYWTKLTNSGQIETGYGSTKYGYIDGSATIIDRRYNTTYKGIHINSDAIIFSANTLGVKSSRNSSSALPGGSGYLICVNELDDNNNPKSYITVHFVNGMLVSDIS